MPGRFVFLYFMKKDPDLIREIAPSHAVYWKTRQLERYLGGPFADRTGGLITFETTTIERAMELVEGDPFMTHDLLDAKWVQEWEPEPAG
jgi:uncharacterized protein